MTKEEVIAELIEWELSEYDYEGLKEFFFNTQLEYYSNNPDGLKDMLQYKKKVKGED